MIDSHAHLTCAEFASDLDSVLERAKASGVTHIVNICTSIEELEQGLIVSQKYPWIVNVGSTTPHDVDGVDDSVFDQYADYAKKGSLAAIGETGLDYYYEHSPRDAQRKSLEKYMQLSLDLKLPIVIHCFTGTQAEAEIALERGYYISLSGIVTFKKSVELQEAAKIVPLSQMLMETDAPYLAPQGHRGKRNEPAFIKDTALFLAQLKKVSFDEICAATISNAMSIFYG